MTTTHTEKIAEDAADCVLRTHGYYSTPDAEILASNIETLGWALGEHITYERGLPDLVSAAVAIARVGNLQALTTILAAAEKWRNELIEHIIPNSATSEAVGYEAEAEAISVAHAALNTGRNEA